MVEGIVPGGAASRREPLLEELRRIWETRPGALGWLASVDHKEIGIRYLVTAFVFLILGGVEALILRVQLAGPDLRLLTPEQYNQLFTMHGVTMIFLYALPMLSGFSNYLWPLLLGSRDMAFPRLNALSYWIFLFSGIFIYSTLPFGQAPNAGWFNYVPFTERNYAPGLGIDVFALGIVFLGISTTVGSINFVVTLLRTRAPGMSIDRIPILVWGTLTASVANIFAVPAVSAACILLWLDRQFGMHFFDAGGGGQPLLWQHLFWIFGHPWVYALVLPAMGIVSDALPTFCRRPLVGYTAVALATVLTMVLGFGVWTHHMFATGLPGIALSFFGVASIMIAVPSAVAVFAWIATIWTGRPVFTAAFLFFAGFVILFVIGGVSGFMTAAVPFDWQLTDTYFVVAHLHYVLLGINVFPVIGGIFYWFPKMTGRLMDERLGKWTFWVVFVGFNVAFFPMHIAGLLGMPRRIYTYPDGLGWGDINLVTSIGSAVFAAGILMLIVNIVRSLASGAPAGPNPWDAPTLEWSVPSPPPPYNFAAIPCVASRHPLWEDRMDGGPRSVLDTNVILDRGRETLATTPLDASPDAVLRMPEDSLWPLALAAALTVVFCGLLFNVWWIAGIGVAASVLAGLGWLWPKAELAEASDRAESEWRLAVAPGDRRASGWYGMIAAIATEASLFAYLLFSYFYLLAQTHAAWPPGGRPKLMLAGANTAFLLLSSIVVRWGERGIKAGNTPRLGLGLGIGMALGAIFVALQVLEWGNKAYGPGTDAYGSLYFTITGFHMAHVAVGLIVLAALWGWNRAGHLDRSGTFRVSVGAVYWHFVDAVWLLVFATFYLSPYLMVTS